VHPPANSTVTAADAGDADRWRPGATSAPSRTIIAAPRRREDGRALVDRPVEKVHCATSPRVVRWAPTTPYRPAKPLPRCDALVPRQSSHGLRSASTPAVPGRGGRRCGSRGLDDALEQELHCLLVIEADRWGEFDYWVSVENTRLETGSRPWMAGTAVTNDHTNGGAAVTSRNGSASRRQFRRKEIDVSARVVSSVRDDG
jgi:hypothetical protein